MDLQQMSVIYAITGGRGDRSSCRDMAAGQGCIKITILDLKDRDLFIDLDLLHDLDQFIDLLKLILIFDLQNCRSFCNHF